MKTQIEMLSDYINESIDAIKLEMANELDRDMALYANLRLITYEHIKRVIAINAEHQKALLAIK